MVKRQALAPPRRIHMSAEKANANEPQDEALSDDDLKAVAGGLDEGKGGVPGEAAAGGAPGEAW
jgi:hypothetical protein